MAAANTLWQGTDSYIIGQGAVVNLKSLFSKKSSGVGIELTPERINVVRLKKQGQKLKLQTLATAEVPEGVFEEGQIVDSPTMAEIIQTTLAENKIKVSKASTAVPGRAVTRVILVPF